MKKFDLFLENSHLTWLSPWDKSKDQVFPPSVKLVLLTAKSAGPESTLTVLISSMPEAVVSSVASKAIVPKKLVDSDQPQVLVQDHQSSTPTKVIFKKHRTICYSTNEIKSRKIQAFNLDDTIIVTKS